MTPELTPRELEVLMLMQTWLTSEEIGGRLGISTDTVKTHARSIYRKFGVGSRREAVAYARTHGIITPVHEGT